MTQNAVTKTVQIKSKTSASEAAVDIPDIKSQKTNVLNKY